MTSHFEDVIALLKQMNDKMDVCDSEIQALNKRVFKVESEPSSVCPKAKILVFPRFYITSDHYHEPIS
ncbi:MAG: hypothetical protein LPK26_14585 [Bacillaceae bacterium]|nr:hypothetical protein [Bacillaceae bacterium]